ncbi:MAG: hypothetical protein C5B59_16845 [Bacteroidetes bacterium]|nr:MAG: hypothetical protein C5B59_16845 [Bacteroidota bacterium]
MFEKMIIFSFVIFSNLACSKSSNNPPPPKPKSPDEILTSKTWKIMEDHGLYGNTPIDYTRGGAGNTLNLDGDSLRFNADGTGTQWTNIPSPGSYPINWNFIDSQKTQLTFTLHWSSSFSVVYYWGFNILAEDSINYEDQYSSGGINDYETVIRKPTQNATKF